MTDHDHPAPDPIVQTALRLLPVPEHGDAFWGGLDALLDAEPPRQAVEPALAAGPPSAVVQRLATSVVQPQHEVELVPERPLGAVPPALRRRSNVVLSAVAVAAAVMVVVAGSALVRQRSGNEVGTSDLADSADAPEDDVVSATSTSVATSAGSAAEVSTQAVLSWVAALGHGDTDAAWAALGPASQAHFGSRSAFAAEGSGLAEGYGAWSAATPEDVLVTPVVSSGDGELVVVTLVGVVHQEGTAQHRADAFPVRVVDGSAHVEPFAFAGELEVVVPEPAPVDGTRPVVRTDDALVIVVPRGVEAPIIRLDDGDPLVCGEAAGTELTELEGAPGQRCSYHPDGGIRPGERVLTVAFRSPDGSGISAESVLFEAA